MLVGSAFREGFTPTSFKNNKGSARGFDANDPDPATTPFTKNLAAADAADYPNLGNAPAATRVARSWWVAATMRTLQRINSRPPTR